MGNEGIATLAVKHAPAMTGAAGIILLGAPLGVLVASFLGATLSFYFDRGLAEKRFWWVVFGVVTLAWAGAWTAMALPHIGVFEIGAMATKVDPSVRGGLCALAFQSAWNLSNKFADRKAEGH